MNAHPNDRYYTVAEVQQAKNFRADMRQFIKDSAPDWILSGETRAVIEVGGRFRHVPGRRRMSWVSTEAVARGKIAFDQAMDEYLNRKRFEGMFGEPNPSGQPCLANETEDKPFDMAEMAKTIAELSDIKRDPYGRVISANQGTIEEIQALRDAAAQTLAWMNDPDVGKCLPVDPESRLYWPHTDVLDDEMFDILCGPWPDLEAVEGRSILDDDNAHLHGEVLEFFARPQRMTDDLWEQMTADERDLDDDHPGMDETEYLTPAEIEAARQDLIENSAKAKAAMEPYSRGLHPRVAAIREAVERGQIKLKRIKPSDHEAIIQNADPDENADICSDPKFGGES